MMTGRSAALSDLRRSAAALLPALALATALPCRAADLRAPDLASSFSGLSAGIKAGAAGIGKAPAFEEAVIAAFRQSSKDDFRQVENAFKGMGAMPDPAEMVARKGFWNLELIASESSVSYSSNGFVWKEGRKLGKKAGLRFTQEIQSSENPYTDRAAVFRVQETGIRVARFSRLNGDPAPVALDLQKPADFTTVYDLGWGLKTEKAYSCRSNDADRLLCKVAVTEYGVVPIPGGRTLYLGFGRAKN